ncbi:hypothetical protein MKW94_023018 [Papaver nudicaule]|uniref:Uncharacterized protein n=1 Tax=Papaver nudicaule TaxID=74823 RepID=A0AA41S2U9_PAPNU|nr:hypothetical protein [Papaver nudicaule]
MTCNPHLALAASGGRMGGRSFSSSSSSESSSSTSGSSSWDSSSSSSSSSPSYSWESSSSSSSPSYSWESSSSSSSPSYSSRSTSSYYSSPSPSYYSSGYYSKPKLKTASETEDEAWSFLLTRKCQISKPFAIQTLRVALLGATRSLQKDLDTIAEVADTSTTSGLSCILQESTVALLRHLAFCFSSFSSVDIKQNKTDGENLFNQLTIEERAKFDEETLVNVDNIKKKITPRKNPNGLNSDYIVMTILVATKGECKLCVVNNSEELKQALQKLGSIPTSKILAVEVMWTPQEENDTLSECDLLKDYPRLKPL